MARESAGKREWMAWHGSRRGERHSPYWLITRKDDGMPAQYTTILGGEALPIFGFEEEAEMFLKFAGMGGARRIRLTTTGELLSILSGPCKSLRWVVFDPLPGIVAKPISVGSSRMERERFMAFLMSGRIREAGREMDDSLFAGRGFSPDLGKVVMLPGLRASNDEDGRRGMGER